MGRDFFVLINKPRICEECGCLAEFMVEKIMLCEKCFKNLNTEEEYFDNLG